MTTWKAKAHVRRDTGKILGRKYIRLTCGTCGHKSRWASPQHLDQRAWMREHYLKNDYCATTGEP